MKIVQCINNNVIISEDSLGNEIVLIGKGIGFNGKKGNEINEDQVDKVFVLKNHKEIEDYQKIVEDLPYEILTFGLKAVNYIVECSTKKISQKHLTLPLIDHLATTIERMQSGITFDPSLIVNVAYLYKEEYKIATDVCDMMASDFRLEVPEAEANFIALHIIDSELDLDKQDGYLLTRIVESAVRGVEEYFSMKINHDSMAYSRFITHLQFFARRIILNTPLDDYDEEINDFVAYKYPESYACAQSVLDKIANECNVVFERRESIYLTIHIERLITKKGD